MNTFKILITIVLWGLFSLNLKGECPPGFEEHSIEYTYTYQVGEVLYKCPLLLVFCCKWDPEIRRVVVIPKAIYIEPSSWDCLLFAISYPGGDTTFWNNVHEAMARAAKVFCGPVCPPCDGPPDQWPRFVEIRASHCVRYFNRRVYINDWIDGIEYCDDEVNYCKYTYACCSDYSTSPPETHIRLISAESYGTPQCGTEEPQVPPPGKDWNETWETECFAKGCQ